MRVTVVGLPSRSTTCGRPAPTAMMQACGGLMMALNCPMPNIPKLEMLKVPPWNSSGRSFPARAREARSFTSRDISSTVFSSARFTMGVMSPPSVATATEMSTCLLNLASRASASHEAFAPGTWRKARAQARRTKSFTERGVPAALSSLRSARIGSRMASPFTYRCGMSTLDSNNLLAITRRTLVCGILSSPSTFGSSVAGVGFSSGVDGSVGFDSTTTCSFVVSDETPSSMARMASSFVTVPLRPVPRTCVRSNPCSASSLRTDGQTRMFVSFVGSFGRCSSFVASSCFLGEPAPSDAP
mmetsp:Transcript_8098/g.50091  ORF Transcript_8098/g.50091 Transcript_8098/m.50091 type:complete len:300 (+) Transcript_8098:633-1532(+)